MKSGRQRQFEIRIRRQRRAAIVARESYVPLAVEKLPHGVVAADQYQLLHDRSLIRPRYYENKTFDCVDCGRSEVWTAEQQKWWYEVAKGLLAQKAIRCFACRSAKRMRRSQERRAHIEGLIERHGIEVAARRLKIDIAALEQTLARWCDASKQRPFRSKLR